MTAPQNRCCGTCAHWESPRAEPWVLGRVVIGSCRLGGPTPSDGCSDCCDSEVCDRHEPKEKP